MTEEQKKKCEEIYNLYIDLSLKIRHEDRWVKIAMLLAEVFNKDITEEEAEKILNNIYNNIYEMSEIHILVAPIQLLVAPNTIFCEIVNYFDNDNKENKNNE